MEKAFILFRGHGPFTVDEAFEVAVGFTCGRLERSSPEVTAILNEVDFKGVLAQAFGLEADGERLFTPVPEPLFVKIATKVAPKPKSKTRTKTKKNPEGPESSKDADGPPKKTRKKRA